MKEEASLKRTFTLRDSNPHLGSLALVHLGRQDTERDLSDGTALGQCLRRLPWLDGRCGCRRRRLLGAPGFLGSSVMSSHSRDWLED